MTLYGTLPKEIYKEMPKQMPKSWGFERYTLDLDGSDDYAEVPDDSSLRISDNITVVAWVNLDAYLNANNEEMAIVGKGPSGGGERFFFDIYSENYRWFVRDSGGNGYNVQSPASLNEWVYLGGVYDGSNLKLYVNENLEDSSNIGSITLQDETTWLGVGARPDSAGNPVFYFDGSISLVLIYNRALSADEIRHNMLNYHNPVRNGLQLWLPCEEGQGTTVKDYSTNNNNGTLYGGIAWERVEQWELRAAIL